MAGDNKDRDLQSRIEHLENQLSGLIDRVDNRLNFEFINDATSVLGQKALKQNHNYNYLGERFADYELALLNVKQMGYYIGLGEASKNGLLHADPNLLATSQTLPSKLCTQADCESDWYRFWLRELHCGFTYHRKLWEFCYIAQQLYSHGALQDGKRGVGFGCGEEPLASLFAKYGASAVATDLGLEDSEEQGQGWMSAGQHGSSVEKVRNMQVCPYPDRLLNVSHEFANMNAIPEHFKGGFDFCWSACALEHIGSIELGLRFIESSLQTLRPGGIAVHTTEYNLAEGETIDNCLTVLFQRRHMEALAERLTGLGYVVSPFNLDGGGGVLDGLFDIPPWPWDAVKLNWRLQENFMHLKRSIGGFPCTSVAITVVKPADAQ